MTLGIPKDQKNYLKSEQGGKILKVSQARVHNDKTNVPLANYCLRQCLQSEVYKA